LVEAVNVKNRDSHHYGTPEEHPLRKLIDAANNGEDIWYEFQDGAREGSIAKLVDPSVFKGTGHYINVYLPQSIVVEVSPGKTIKVGVKAYHNNLKFLVGYTGGHVVKFEKGKPKSVIKETTQPDMLGNTIKVGDWVICKPKGYYSGVASGKPVLGKLNRLSAAGNAWVNVSNKQGETVEVMTEGASTLIKIEFTPELHTTYMLYDGFDGLRTKLKLDLDYEAMEAGE
jgi:hypothetical protein